MHQYFACGVTQPQLLEFLWDIGVSISSGELSNLITKGHESFHQEKDDLLAQYQDVHFLSEKAWKAFMNDIGLTGSRNRQRASEAMLYGSLISHGFNLVTFSDGAGQFNVFAHAQCWVHAARPMEKVIPVNRQQVNAQYWCLSWFWNIYRDLKAFRESPSGEKAAEIRVAFKSLIQTQTGCSGLQEALAGLAVIEQELLMVLDNPGTASS
ncbi:hypothetical protein [Endozoicomonas sp. SCSIO W0465]|uniref:hypothetical protein n=1 Tax=Endozoicomonas sp. SCSIO W0465 TaxID=2918516 RepID=UPI002076116F|nr:hypothetical protein [Endozoicomonas sp. SCSIO W0465]USE34167.1 hypothetical protein MJO57_18590 [Endozoicomonas sp. SCSIO W0465]